MQKKTEIRKYAENHVQFQKSCKKIQKSMLNMKIHAQKEQECIFDFEIHPKKAKIKKESTFFIHFLVLYLMCHAHQSKNPKKGKQKFSNSKNIYATKGRKYYFKKFL